MTEESGWDKPMFDSAVLVDHKAEYIKKPKHYDKQSQNRCIICSIVKYEEQAVSYEVCRSDKFLLFLNLYPYTNAHILISPLEHIVNYEDIPPEDLQELSLVTQRIIRVLKHFGNTDSFNVGWNQGSIAGGSIKHFHMHVVPRYRNEMNFMEIIARTRPFIKSLDDTMNDLKKYTPYLLDKKSFEDTIAEF